MLQHKDVNAATGLGRIRDACIEGAYSAGTKLLGKLYRLAARNVHMQRRGMHILDFHPVGAVYGFLWKLSLDFAVGEFVFCWWGLMFYSNREHECGSRLRPSQAFDCKCLDSMSEHRSRLDQDRLHLRVLPMSLRAAQIGVATTLVAAAGWIAFSAIRERPLLPENTSLAPSQGHPSLPNESPAQLVAEDMFVHRPFDRVQPSLPNDETPKRQSFADKYAGLTLEQLLDARKEIVSIRVQLVDRMLKELMTNGHYEVVTLKPGEEYSPALPTGWAAGHLGVGAEDGTQELRVVRLDVPNHPETAVMYAEALWLGERIDSLGGRPTGVSLTR